MKQKWIRNKKKYVSDLKKCIKFAEQEGTGVAQFFAYKCMEELQKNANLAGTRLARS